MVALAPACQEPESRSAASYAPHDSRGPAHHALGSSQPCVSISSSSHTEARRLPRMRRASFFSTSRRRLRASSRRDALQARDGSRGWTGQFCSSEARPARAFRKRETAAVVVPQRPRSLSLSRFYLPSGCRRRSSCFPFVSGLFRPVLILAHYGLIVSICLLCVYCNTTAVHEAGPAGVSSFRCKQKCQQCVSSRDPNAPNGPGRCGDRMPGEAAKMAHLWGITDEPGRYGTNAYRLSGGLEVRCSVLLSYGRIR